MVPYQYSQSLYLHPCTLTFQQLPMKLLKALVVAASVLRVAAIDCPAKELAKYGFQNIKGVYTAKSTRDTPPLKQALSWSLGICQNVDEVADCPKNSDLCGITRLQIDDKEYLAEVIGFNSNLQTSYAPFTEEGSNKDSGITVSYSGVNWGDNLVDAEIRFVCVKKGASNENKLSLKTWDGKVFKGEFPTSAACISEKSAPKPGKERNPDDTGESWGWFTWIFIFIVLFLSIYIVGGAWFQYNKGNAIDFQTALREVLENFVDLLRGLPAFFREIVEKVTGNSHRGEYSAV